MSGTDRKVSRPPLPIAVTHSHHLSQKASSKPPTHRLFAPAMRLQKLLGSSKAQPPNDTMLHLAFDMQFTPDGRAVTFGGRFGCSPEIVSSSTAHSFQASFLQSSTSAKATPPPAPTPAAVDEKKLKKATKEGEQGKKKEETTKASPSNVVVHIHQAPPASHSRRASTAHCKHQAIDITAAATAGRQNVVVVRNSRAPSCNSSSRSTHVSPQSPPFPP